MTRLLIPEMFGLMAVATTFIVGLAMFSDLGLKQNVVQSRRGHEPEFLNSAWSLQIIRGLLIFLLALLLSFAMLEGSRLGVFPTGSVYAAPNLPYVLAVLSISAVIMGFESTKLYEASREILLGRITALELVAQLSGLLCMIAWVSFDRSIWALVSGAIAASLSRTILSHTLLPGTDNHWQWNKDAIYELVHFGKWILAASVLGFLVNSGDRLILGGLVDARLFGYYAIASLFVGSAEGVLSKLMGEVSFPAFSEVVRNRAGGLKKSYYRFLAVIASVSYFAAGFLMTFGQALVDLLYDRRYHDAGWMLEISSVVLLTVPFRLATQSFLALGMPRLQSHIVLIRLISLVIATPVGFNWFGLEGALVGIVFSHFSYIPLIVYYNWKHQLLDILTEVYLLAVVPLGLIAGRLLALLTSYWS